MAVAYNSMNWSKNIHTLCSTPGMLPNWLRWNMRYFRIAPTVTLPSGDQLQGFRSFSEFWSGLNMAPPIEELNFIRQYAGEGGLILDVGANIGVMALEMSRARPQCVVHAFEPSPETFACLKANLSRNKADSVIPQHLAVGGECGRLKFLNDSRSPATNRLLASNSDSSAPMIEVEVTTLDTFMEDHSADDIAFLKVDVEGYEPDVLRGSAHLLNSGRCRAGLVELCPANLHAVGYQVKDLLVVVESHGWKLFHLGSDGMPGSVVTEESASCVILENVALLPSR